MEDEYGHEDVFLKEATEEYMCMEITSPELKVSHLSGLSNKENIEIEGVIQAH